MHAEKLLSKSKCLHVKSSRNVELDVEEMDLNMKKAVSEKPTAYIVLNGEKLEAIPLKSGMHQECQLSSFPFQCCV